MPEEEVTLTAACTKLFLMSIDVEVQRSVDKACFQPLGNCPSAKRDKMRIQNNSIVWS